jgi:hypothetical protein
MLWRQVNPPLIWELMASSVLAFVIGEWVDTFGVLTPEVRLT